MRTSSLLTLRMFISAGLVAALAIVSSRLPQLYRISLALFLLLVVVGIATRWGFPEAVTAALVGGFSLDYFLLPPSGIGIESPQDWVVLSVFLTVAITTSHLSARARQKTIEAIARQRELEKLYAFGQDVIQRPSLEETVRAGLESVLRVFEVPAAAIYYQPDDRIIRAGSPNEAISDDRLRQVSRSGVPLLNEPCDVSIIPVELGLSRRGSLGLIRAKLHETMLHAIAQRLGVAIEQARVVEEEMTAESARKSQELKSLILDGLAHQLKTPLTTIKIAATSLLGQNREARASSIELLKVIDEETSHLEKFLNDALQMARIDSGILNLEKGLHEIHRLIDSSLRELGVALEGRPVEVRLPTDLPPTLFDFQILKLVFQELLMNALKYSPSGSPVTISSHVDADAIVVSVADSGKGIAEEEKHRIFDKYYRSRQEPGSVSGTGLGLAIVKNMIEAHQGGIWVSSRPGGGSVFSFSLPLLKETVS